jgi:hypothetical protein
MRPDILKAGTVKWRALLIIGVLISLCLSDTVGPRLLPIPVSGVVTTASADVQQGTEPAASSAPASTKGVSPRVEMAGTAQNRAGADHKHVQVAAQTPRGVPEAPAGIILGGPGAYRPLYSLSALVSRPPGRAPPRLV